MESLRIWTILTWISLPTVMYGGYSLLRIMQRGDRLNGFQLNAFRAGHAHAGVLILMALLYQWYIGATSLPVGLKHLGSVLLFIGVLAQSGGFFLHMIYGTPKSPSIGTTVTTLGAVLLALAIALLVYGLIAFP